MQINLNGRFGVRILAALTIAVGSMLITATPLLDDADAATPDDHLIVPGQRIGPVSIGMGPSALLQALGPPDSSNFNGVDATQYLYNRIGIMIWTRNDLVVEISVFNNQNYHTANGLHVGSSELELLAANGAPVSKKDNMSFLLYCYNDGTEYDLGRPNSSNPGKIINIAIDGLNCS